MKSLSAAAVALTIAFCATSPTSARAQDEVEAEAEESTPAPTAAELRSDLSMYERRAIIFGVTGATLVAGGIATFIVATAAYSGSFCDRADPDCIETAKLINAASAGGMILGVLSLIVTGLSKSAADRTRDALEDEDEARLRVDLAASPGGGGVVLTGAF